MQGRLQIAMLSLVLFHGAAGASAQVRLQGSTLDRRLHGSAVDRLLNAEIFALGPVGFAYRTSQEEVDYRLILGQPAALVSFEKLYAEGNMQAKSYALTGIHQLSPARFEELYASLPDSKDKVTIVSGCVISGETLRDVARSLATSPGPAK
jgi:hypothetical protein